MTQHARNHRYGTSTTGVAIVRGIRFGKTTVETIRAFVNRAMFAAGRDETFPGRARSAFRPDYQPDRTVSKVGFRVVGDVDRVS